MAIPRMAAIHQPQEIRFAMAMAPKTITRMIAMGVSQSRMFVSRAVAPVMKGEVAWANTRSGIATRTTNGKKSGRGADCAVF